MYSVKERINQIQRIVGPSGIGIKFIIKVILVNICVGIIELHYNLPLIYFFIKGLLLLFIIYYLKYVK